MANVATILAVDDEANIRRLIRLELESQNFAVIEAEDGHSAIDLALDRKPDAVVLDIAMPDMSGLDVLSAIRAVSAVPVILVTGRDQAADKVRGLDCGADDYITKPFNPE